MPAVSKAQRRAMAIAKHHPEKLYKRNRGLLKMSDSQLHEFASTKEKLLVAKKKAKKKKKPKPGQVDYDVKKAIKEKRKKQKKILEQL